MGTVSSDPAIAVGGRCGFDAGQAFGMKGIRGFSRDAGIKTIMERMEGNAGTDSYDVQDH